MQGAARAFGFAFGVQGGGDRRGVGVEFNHRVERGASLVDGGDTIQIAPGEGVRGEAARGHALLQIGDGGFFQFECGRRGQGAGGQGDGV